MRKALILCLVLITIPAAATTFSLSGGAWPAGVAVVSTNGHFQLSGGCLNPCAFAGSTVWHDALVPNGASTTLTFSSAINSFGGTWDLWGPGGPGVGINVYFDSVFAGLIDHNTAGTFVGFNSLTPFTTVLLRADGQGSGIETYEMASLTYTGVPEPATIMLVGLGALVLTRRVRKG